MKICPKCRKPAPSEGILECKECNLFYVEASEIGLTLSKEDLKAISQGILRNPRFWTVLIVVAAVSSWGVLELVERFTRRSAASVVQSAEETISNKLAVAYASITNQIVLEFDVPRIRETVRSVAEGQAAKILREQVEPSVDEFKKQVGSRLEELEGERTFLDLASRGMAYDFGAYRELQKMSIQKDSFAEKAQIILGEIDRRLEEDRFSTLVYNYAMVWGTNVYKGPFTSDEIGEGLSYTNLNRAARDGLASEIGKRKELMFLPRLVELALAETDLLTANRMVLVINNLTGQQFSVRKIDSLRSWWAIHGSSYTNWPYSEYVSGLRAVESGKCRDSVESLRRVIGFDKGADKSRAVAVFCYLENGETNNAVVVMKDFSDKSGRWAKLAAVKFELTTGSVERATTELVELANEHPECKAFYGPGWPIWRAIDWEGFNRRVPPEAKVE